MDASAFAHVCPLCGGPCKPIWEFDHGAAILRVRGRSIQLSTFQADMLQLLGSPAGRIVRRDELVCVMDGQLEPTRSNGKLRAEIFRLRALLRDSGALGAH